MSVVANRAFFSSNAGRAYLYIDGTKRTQDVHGWRYIIVWKRIPIINHQCVNGATSSNSSQCVSKRNSFASPQALSRLKRVALNSPGKVRQARWRNTRGGTFVGRAMRKRQPRHPQINKCPILTRSSSITKVFVLMNSRLFAYSSNHQRRFNAHFFPKAAGSYQCCGESFSLSV